MAEAPWECAPSLCSLGWGTPTAKAYTRGQGRGREGEVLPTYTASKVCSLGGGGWGLILVKRVEEGQQ